MEPLNTSGASPSNPQTCLQTLSYTSALPAIFQMKKNLSSTSNVLEDFGTQKLLHFCTTTSTVLSLRRDLEIRSGRLITTSLVVQLLYKCTMGARRLGSTSGIGLPLPLQ